MKNSGLKSVFFLVSVCGQVTNEGWLMVFVFAPIDERTLDEENTELVVKVKNELVPMQKLTGLFVGPKCASYAQKPKVFFFLDLDAGKRVDGPAVSSNFHDYLFMY